MKGFLFRPKHLAIMILWLALAGCLGGPSAPTNFYMLSPLSPSQAGTISGKISSGGNQIMGDYRLTSPSTDNGTWKAKKN
jgi:hypothetical protein